MHIPIFWQIVWSWEYWLEVDVINMLIIHGIMQIGVVSLYITQQPDNFDICHLVKCVYMDQILIQCSFGASWAASSLATPYKNISKANKCMIFIL